MFAKLAHFGHFGRTHDAGFAPWPANDNGLPRLVGASRRPRRNLLACHWHRTPSGALECVWSVEDGDTGRRRERCSRPEAIRSHRPRERAQSRIWPNTWMPRRRVFVGRSRNPDEEQERNQSRLGDVSSKWRTGCVRPARGSSKIQWSRITANGYIVRQAFSD
jgi:hypothetical protein